MLNWCKCFAIITGNQDALEEIEKSFELPDAEGDHLAFSFHQLVPRPTGLDDGAWNCKNWGTKYDADDPKVDVKNDCIYISFMCVSSPPIAWMRKVAKDLNVRIELDYSESGVELFGTAIATEQCVVDDRQKPEEDELW